MRLSRKYDYQRAKCEDLKVISEWFALVYNTKAKYGILDDDIYNFDETGFIMGVAATLKVVTSSDTIGRATVVQLGNRDWVTTIECINASGWLILPFIILPRKLY